MILPYVHHFLAWMHTLLKKAKKRQAAVGIPEEVCQDLMLMDRVIKQANKGVDMNNLARIDYHQTWSSRTMLVPLESEDTISWATVGDGSFHPS